MNYEEMSDFEIEQSVANHEGVFWHVKPCDSPTGGWLYSDNYELCDTASGQTAVELPNYCNNPSDAWPIIETIWSELSSVVMFDDGIGFGERNMTMWNAQSAMMSCGKLRAAMIVFLKMQETV